MKVSKKICESVAKSKTLLSGFAVKNNGLILTRLLKIALQGFHHL